MSDSSRLQTLQRSISVQEVALASLKGEFERQKEELVSSEEEVAKLRRELSKKAGLDVHACYRRFRVAMFINF